MPPDFDRAPLIQTGIVDFIIASDRLKLQIETALRPLGINLTQMSLLNRLARTPEQAETISDLTQVMSVHQPGITKAVGALVEKGCLDKTDSTQDARMKLIRITAKGLTLLTEARRLSYPCVNAAFSSLTDPELATVTTALKKMKNDLTGA